MTPDMNSLIHQAQKLKEVKRLAQSGRMIDAIKLYREITNVGLKEAKDAVEALQRGDPFIRLDDVSTTATPQAEKMKEVVRLIKEGNKLEAIKVFREATGVGLKDAKEAVEAIERNRSATINTVQTSTPYTTIPATPSTSPIMETVSPLNGVVILFLLLVLLISGAAALAWFVLPELRGVILSFLK